MQGIKPDSLQLALTHGLKAVVLLEFALFGTTEVVVLIQSTFRNRLEVRLTWTLVLQSSIAHSSSEWYMFCDHFLVSIALGVVSAGRSPSTNWIAPNIICASAGVSKSVGVCPIAQLKTRPSP